MMDVLFAEEVARLLRVHVRTVYRLARAGKIPGKKLGGGWRFSKEQILKMLDKEKNDDHETLDVGRVRAIMDKQTCDLCSRLDGMKVVIAGQVPWYDCYNTKTKENLGCRCVIVKED